MMCVAPALVVPPALGSSGAAVFETLGNQLGVATVARASFALGAALSDVYFAMRAIQQSGATILLFIGAITDMQQIITALTVGDTANGSPPLGLYGPGYQWIGLHSYMQTVSREKPDTK